MDNPRFMRLEDVADELNVNMPLVRALVQRGELPAIKLGGRGIWRVERSAFEAFIVRQYEAVQASAGVEVAEDEDALS